MSLPFIVALTLLFVSCKKDDGFINKQFLSQLEAVPAISTAINATGSQAIDLLSLGTFVGKIDVSSYFPNDAVQAAKVDIVVRKNGLNSNVKVYKSAVTTLPVAYTFNAADIAALFGTPILLGDTYDFGADIYTAAGSKYEAFPLGGVGNSAGPINMIGYSEFARFAAICAYDPAIYQGNFVVVSDAFGDFVPGEIVPITKIDNTHFSFIDPYVTNPVPIIVTVNTLNNQLTIAKQKIGNAFTWNLTYTNPNMAVTAGTASFVAPCSKTIDLNITYTVDQGGFGTLLLKLRKQ